MNRKDPTTETTLHRPEQTTWRKPAPLKRSDNDNNPAWADSVPLGFSPKPGK